MLERVGMSAEAARDDKPQSDVAAAPVLRDYPGAPAGSERSLGVRGMTTRRVEAR